MWRPNNYIFAKAKGLHKYLSADQTFYDTSKIASWTLIHLPGAMLIYLSRRFACQEVEIYD